MKVVVDPQKCNTCLLCVFMMPTHFRVFPFDTTKKKLKERFKVKFTGQIEDYEKPILDFIIKKCPAQAISFHK